MNAVQKQKPMQNLQAGFTLVELMIAMVVGLLLAVGLVTLVVGSQNSFRLDQSVARMQDEARYAVSELTKDLRMAGYVADPMTTEAFQISVNANAAQDCGVAGQPDWILRFRDTATGDSTLLSAVDNAGAGISANFSCIGAGEIVPNTDVVAIKRFAGNSVPSAAVVPNTMYLRSNDSQAILYRAPLVDPFPADADDNWEYRPHIYYIRNFSNVAGDNIPALCRKQITFDAGGTGMDTECLASGVEDMQLEYGVDTTGDGSANSYLASPTPLEMETVVSIRVFILARTQEADRADPDPKTYTVSNAPVRTPADAFTRRLYSVTVPTVNLRNQELLRNYQ
jgi:type IV pilus assembly protein PilW